MVTHALMDTGFWIALCNHHDAHHGEAVLIAEYLEGQSMVVPWPCLYETLNTKFFRRKDWVEAFQTAVTQSNVDRLEDEPYRERAWSAAFDPANYGMHRSLVDCVIREVLVDSDIRVDALVTFNERDFADVCALRGIEFLRA